MLTIIQLMLLALLVFFVWNSLVKTPPPPPKPAAPPKSDVVVIQDGNVVVAGGDKKPAGGGGGGGGGGLNFQPRSYLAWFGFFLILLFTILAFITPNNPSVIDFGSILTFPLKPLGLALFLLFLALPGIKKDKITKDAAMQVKVAFFVLAIFSLPLVSSWLIQQGEVEALNSVRAAAQRREKVGTIVLLGQASTQQNLLEPNQIQLTDASDRILQTAKEYKRQRSLGNRPLVVVSAGPRPGMISGDPNQVNFVEARDIGRILTQLGIPGEDILLEPTGVDVRTSALAARRLLDKGIIGKRVILVSSALNIQRARQTFAKLGIETVPSPAGFYTFQSSGAIPRILVRIPSEDACRNVVNISIRPTRQIRIADFIPSADSLLISTRFVNEFWTSVYYILRGWVAPSVDAVYQEVYPKC